MDLADMVNIIASGMLAILLQSDWTILRRAYDRFKVSLTVDVTISLILCTSCLGIDYADHSSTCSAL